MSFRLSTRSLRRLAGVNPLLVNVVKRAIEITETDFGVIEGKRTIERQELLFESGKSQTMASKHLIGLAVDLLAYSGKEASWELEDYFPIADAMKEAAKELGAHIRWGGAWHINNMNESYFCAKDMHEDYLDYCKVIDRRPFVDGVHFEIFN